MIELVENNEVFDELYSDMVLQFPKNELKSMGQFKKLVKNPDYKIIECYSSKKRVGYVICFVNNFILIDYFAVYKEFQSMGIGKKILSALFEKYSILNGALFEVEKINHKDINTIRRQNFYKSLGCIDSGVNYFFPTQGSDISMDLLYYPLQKKIALKDEIIIFIKKIFDTIHSDIDSRYSVLEKIH